MSAFGGKADMTFCAGGQMNAEKKAQENSGLKTLKLNRSSLRELAKCLGGTRLDGLRVRKRNFLSQHCELLGLLNRRRKLKAQA